MALRGDSSRRSTPRGWLWSILGSATVHVVLIIALVVAASGWLAQRERDRVADDSVAASIGGETLGESPSPGQAPAVDFTAREPEAVLRMMRDQAAEADRLDTRERLAKLDQQAAWLGERNAAHVQRIADELSGLVAGIADHKLAPDPAATGEFDPDSATLYDIAARNEHDGRTVYDWTLVDREGRSLVTTIDAADMTAQDLAAARVFDLARVNQNLRTLVDAARRIVASRPEAETASEALGN